MTKKSTRIIKTFENYSDSLVQLIRLKEFYLKKGDDRGFSRLCKFNYASRAGNDKIETKTNISSVTFFITQSCFWVLKIK